MDAWIEPRTEGAEVTIALGTMNFGKRTPPHEAERIVARALDRGIVVFDTANVYSDGESERILGRALRGCRASVRIATKVGLGQAGDRREGLAPERVLAAASASLERLGTDQIDLYYLHAPDHRVPLAETLGAIEELLASGKIRYWGVSNYASWQILEASHLCAARGMPGPRVSQVLYNLLVRQIEIEYLRFARTHGLHTTVYNVLAGGILTGRHRRAEPIPAGSRFDGNALYQRRYWTDRFFDLVDDLGGVARDAGLSPTALAYAWLAGRAGVDSVLVGPATVDQLDAALDGCARRLSPDVTARIDAVHRAFSGTDASYAR